MTDIPQTALFKIALELGAEHRKGLTVDTTHLIADEHGSAKYNAGKSTASNTHYLRVALVRSPNEDTNFAFYVDYRVSCRLETGGRR